ncbi:hypothetical protein [Sphingomonas sp. NFR04]|uniref:hypothetical protein n=1 Tax=Sphingomonas sp. NFR04 TaxID=1566283 RepID=UPI000B80508B|nr:hypothetical protein [Sphingomonas sp. NFR04]
MAPLGPVHVRLTSFVRGDAKGPGIGIMNAPTAAEATAELHRVARVAGADKVVSVAADYRRAALAGGTTSTQWRIEVQAWGTAMAPVKVEPSEPPEEQRAQDADKVKDRAKDQDAAKQAQDARADARDSAEQAKSREAAAAEQVAAQHVEAAPPAAAPAPAASAETPAVATTDSTPAPSAPATSER